MQAAFGRLLASLPDSASALWKQLRLAKGTLPGSLHYLAKTHKRSLLGDDRCLRALLPDATQAPHGSAGRLRSRGNFIWTGGSREFQLLQWDVCKKAAFREVQEIEA